MSRAAVRGVAWGVSVGRFAGALTPLVSDGIQVCFA